MFNPFIQFSLEFCRHLMKQNKNYLVSQEMDQIAGSNATKNILITEYSSFEAAEQHLKAIKNKQFAAIIHLTNPKHMQRLEEVIAGKEYKVWWAVIKDAENLRAWLCRYYRDNLRRYVRQHTNWVIGPGQVLPIVLKVVFGELYMCLEWRKQTLSVKFEEIAEA